MSDWDEWDSREDGWVNDDQMTVFRSANEQADKLNRMEAFTCKGDRVLREIAIDFGMHFERSRRRQIEGLIQRLRFCLSQRDEWGIDVVYLELSHEMYEINRAAYLYDLGDDDAASAAVVRR